MLIDILNRRTQLDWLLRRRAPELALAENVDIRERLETLEIIDVPEAIELTVQVYRCWHIFVKVVHSVFQRVGAGVEESEER